MRGRPDLLTAKRYDPVKGSLRLTVGHATTDADVDALLAALPPIVARLREAAAVSV